jgi:hypothetical protein
VYSGATDGAKAYNVHTFEDEVIGPLIASRMKEADNLPRLGINPGQIRTLTEITAVARERQVIGIVGSAVLLRDDVLDVMPQFAMCLAQAAVFAPLASPAADEVPRGRVHLLLKLLASLKLKD